MALRSSISCLLRHGLLFRPSFSRRSLANLPADPLILGIETSCDDTGAAVLSGRKVLGEAVRSQQNQHLNFGGIIPPVAADLHRANIEPVVKEAMEMAGVTLDDLAAIAVTNRPGLALSLTVGIRYAKHLARRANKPLIPIHHMEAHALTVRLEEDVSFPFLCLLISGGHCILMLVRAVDEYLLLGETMDDAPGEAFDKIARRLKLRNLADYRWLSGGAAIEKAARASQSSTRFEYPLPLAKQRDCQFSFSGLKNNAYRIIWNDEKSRDRPVDEVMPHFEDFCAAFLHGVTRHICHRTQRAMEFCTQQGLIGESDRTLVVSGGVACNDVMFECLGKVGDAFGYRTVRPSRKLCTDNGVMIAWNGVERFCAGKEVLDDFEDVSPLGRCKLGEDWTAKVRAADIKCDWVKIPALAKR